MKPRCDMTDEEADMQNAKIFSAISNDCHGFDEAGKPFPADKFFKTDKDAKEKAKSDVKEIVGDEKPAKKSIKPAKKSGAKKSNKAKSKQEKPE